MLLLLRLTLAFIFLYHGWPKAMQPEMAMSKFEGMGFPGFLGPIVGWGEVIASVLLIAGWFTSLASLLLLGVIVVALLGVQLPQGVEPGFERDLQVLVLLLLLLSFGPGRYSLDEKKKNRWLILSKWQLNSPCLECRLYDSKLGCWSGSYGSNLGI
jgi:putative oxidoreductase